MISRMRVLSRPRTIGWADRIMRAIIDTYFVAGLFLDRLPPGSGDLHQEHGGRLIVSWRILEI
jgi:hypothetical protein